jgi:hypothetical protein
LISGEPVLGQSRIKRWADSYTFFLSSSACHTRSVRAKLMLNTISWKQNPPDDFRFPLSDIGGRTCLELFRPSLFVRAWPLHDSAGMRDE